MPASDERVAVVIATHNRLASLQRTLEQLLVLPEQPEVLGVKILVGSEQQLDPTCREMAACPLPAERRPVSSRVDEMLRLLR